MAEKSSKTVQVAKYEITYVSGYQDFHSAQNILWKVQKEVRLIKNITIQTAHEFKIKALRHYNETQQNLNEKEELGMTLENACYHASDEQAVTINTRLKNAASRSAYSHYNSHYREIINGSRSLDYYKGDQPIPIPGRDVELTYEKGRFLFTVGLISKNYKKSISCSPKEKLVFRVHARDNSRKEILERVISGEYGIAESQIVYRSDKDKKKKWFLLLSYAVPTQKVELDKKRILGVDLGITEPAVASVLGGKPFFVRGAEADEKENRKRGIDYAYEMERKKADLQRQANFCGDGRIGHGRKTRLAPLEKAKNKISNYQDTLNHTYSKRIVEYAVKCGCGIIQMEDLSKINETALNAKRLKHWTYYDLQTKIENKAKLYGIKVVKVHPQYTSQRCSSCGHIEKENRPEQAVFKCLKCGFARNADYNASQNLATKNIDKIIEKTLSAST